MPGGGGAMLLTDDWLPVGSVVGVAGSDGPLMIAGYMMQDLIDGRLWDYAGVPFPSGFTDEDEFRAFDRVSISGIRFLGYQDASYLEMRSALMARQNEFELAKLESMDAGERREYLRAHILWKTAQRELLASSARVEEELARKMGVDLDLSSMALAGSGRRGV